MKSMHITNLGLNCSGGGNVVAAAAAIGTTISIPLMLLLLVHRLSNLFWRTRWWEEEVGGYAVV